MNEYVFPEDMYNERKMSRIFVKFDRACFNGHTHMPGIMLEVETGKWEYIASADCVSGYRLTHQKFICNVGSVGQPRDGDPRACYVLYDGKTIRYRRVKYDIETTVRKIHAIPELENFLGDRLRDGR